MNTQCVTQLVRVEQVEKLIHLVRGEKVLLDADLAVLYGVETRALNQAVKRNPSRFPADFMFQLTIEEVGSLLRSRSQSVILKERGKNIKYLPYAFTEQGVAMSPASCEASVPCRSTSPSCASSQDCSSLQMKDFEISVT